MTKYSKSIIALLGGVATWGATAAPDGFTVEELFGVLAVIAVALGVYAVPNTPAEVVPV